MISTISDGIAENDWISLKLSDLYSEFSVLCSAVSEICTEETCPIMKSRSGLVYYWADPGLRPQLVSGRRYMEKLMSWAECFLTQESPEATFIPKVKIFCRRFFRVYAHLFGEHHGELISMEKHLRFSLFHFLLFMKEFNVLVNRRDAEPLLYILTSFGIPNLHFPAE